MLYIRTLIICDQDDQEVFKTGRTPAIKGLQEALRVVNEKDGPRSFKEIIKRYKDQLDKEFQEYFNMG